MSDWGKTIDHEVDYVLFTLKLEEVTALLESEEAADIERRYAALCAMRQIRDEVERRLRHLKETTP